MNNNCACFQMDSPGSNINSVRCATLPRWQTQTAIVQSLNCVRAQNDERPFIVVIMNRWKSISVSKPNQNVFVCVCVVIWTKGLRSSWFTRLHQTQWRTNIDTRMHRMRVYFLCDSKHLIAIVSTSFSSLQYDPFDERRSVGNCYSTTENA